MRCSFFCEKTPHKAGFSNLRSAGSPSVVLLTQNAYGPGLVVFAFRARPCGSHSNKNITPAFRLPTWAKQLAHSKHKFKNRPNGRFSNLRSAGVEPTFPASEADALSIELRARKSS